MRTAAASIDRRSRLTLRCVMAAVMALVLVGAIFPTSPASSSTAKLYVVAPGGSDTAPGTAEEPFATLGHAFDQLEAGDVLTVRGGTYRERIDFSARGLADGGPDKPVTVRAATGERPVLEGSIVFRGVDHWNVHGLDVTWARGNDTGGHLIEIRGGTGFRYSDAEVWDSRGRGAIFVGNGADDFRLDHLYVHSTHVTHGKNEDHLLYLGEDIDGGMVERNVLADSPNGRGIKLGRTNGRVTADVVIRYNTFYNNLGPSNVRLSGNVTGADIHRNLFVKSGRRQAAVTQWKLSGEGNTVSDNAVWDAKKAVATHAGLEDAGGNRELNPKLADPEAGDLRPTNPEAEDYGAHAPGDSDLPDEDGDSSHGGGESPTNTSDTEDPDVDEPNTTDSPAPTTSRPPTTTQPPTTQPPTTQPPTTQPPAAQPPVTQPPATKSLPNPGGGRPLAVAPNGSDSGPGSLQAPFRTLGHAMKNLRAGDTLTVRGGTYTENLLLYSIGRGTPDAPITVQAYPGERPVLRGRVFFKNADHWKISGLNVTWCDTCGLTSSNHMVVFNGGVGFRFSHAEVWGARSFAAIVTGYGSRNFQLDNLYVHHTYRSNDANQDHLIYLSSDSVGGVVERNVLAHSPNGRGVKLGPGSLSEPGASGNIIRFNTFFANEGPANIQLSGRSSDNQIYGNLLVRPRAGQESVTTWNLSGTGNVVRDNLAWEASGVLDDDHGLVDGGGNVIGEPRFANPDAGDYRPTNAAAKGYGAHA